MIKAITFDLDGVYFPNGKNNFIKALGDYGISEEAAKGVFLKSDQMNKLYKTGQMTDDEFWAWAKGQWNSDLTPKEIVALLISGYDVDERVIKTIKELKNEGYKTLICSNNFSARVNGLQQRFRFLDDFDAAVFSYQVGAVKPSEIIFKELIMKSEVEAPEIIFSDDNPDNLAGAKNLGISTFIYKDFDKFISALGLLGVKV